MNQQEDPKDRSEEPPKPVDNPDLPETGDPTPFEEKPPEEDLGTSDESDETPEQPHDLSKGVAGDS